MSAKELMLAVVPGGDGEPLLRYASVSGRRILETGEGTPKRISTPFRASVFSLDSYFEQVELAAPTVKLLPLVARRHLDAELVFEDSAYRLQTRVRAQRESTVATDLAAMPEPDLETAAELLPLHQRPCLQMVPVELAIAALVRKATAEPVIVFWEKGGELVSLLIAEGMVRSRMRERVNDDNRGTILARTEASLKTRATQQGSKREVFLTLYAGDLRDLGLETTDKAAKAFETKLTKLYRVGRKLPKDTVLRDPELYGLPFVEKGWSFLEKNYRDQVTAWRFAKPAALAAGLAGIGFAVNGLYLQQQAFGSAAEFDQRQAALRQTRSEIERIRPSNKEIAAARSSLQVQVDSLSEVRLDHLLGWLTHLVPENNIIRSLEVFPLPPPRQDRRTQPVKYPPGQKPFVVKMEITMAETDFDAAEASAAQLIKGLSQRLQMVDSEVVVPAPELGESEARNAVLKVTAHAVAANF